MGQGKYEYWNEREGHKRKREGQADRAVILSRSKWHENDRGEKEEEWKA